MLPSFSLPPLEFCLGTSPIQAEKSRPERKALASPTLATRAVANAGPTPGISSSRLLVSLDRCQAMISRSNSRIWVFSTRRWAPRATRHARAISGTRLSLVSATTSSSASTPLRPTGATMPNSARWARIALITAVCWRMNRWRAMEHQTTLLLGRLGLNVSHVCPGNCFADCLGVGGIVLVSLHVRLDIGWRHQANGVAECVEFARPMMRRCAGLDTDETRRQLLEESNDVTTLQLAPDDHLAFRVDAMDLKNRLRDVETNRRDRLHGPVLRIRSPPWRPRSVALTCRWRSRPQHQKRRSCRARSKTVLIILTIYECYVLGGA